MATARLCGLSPLLFRRKHYKFEGKRILNMVKGNKEKGKEVKGVKIVKPPGCPKNLKLMANLKKKIMQFRDTIDLPPSDSSKSLAQLMIRTIKDLQYMYPEMSPRIQVSKLKGASMDQILANFYKTLKWIEDSWRMDQDSDFFECDVHINPDQRVENIIGTLDSLMKLTAENFDTMEDGDEKKSSSPESNTYGKIVESNSDSCNNSLCVSPGTPTSVLPELIKAANASCTSPLLMSLRVQAMGKLNPIDVKRLAFHMLPHLRIQDPRNSSFQKNRITEEQVQDANSESEVKKTDHIEEVQDDSTKIQTATDSSIIQAEVSSQSSLQPDYSPSVESLQPTPPRIPVLNTTISASPTPTPPPQPPPLQPNITTPRPMPPPPPLPSRISGPAAAPSPPPPGMLGSVPSTPPPPPPLPGMPGAAPPTPPTTPVLHTTISTSPTPIPPPPPLQPNVTTARPMPPPPPPPARTSGHAAAPPPPSPPPPRMSGAAPPPPPPMMPLKVSTMPPPTSQISEPAAPPPPSPPGMLASASSTPPPQPGMLGSSSSTPPPPPPPPLPRTSGAAPPSPSPMMPLKVSTMPPPTSRISEPAAPPPPPLPGMLASASSTPSPPPGMLGSSSSKPPPPRTSGAAPPPPSPMMPLKGSAMPPPPSQVSGPAAPPPPPPPPPPGMLGSASSTSPSPPGTSGASPPPPQHIMPLKGSAMPPPMPLANGAAPPPPPALGAGRSLRPKKATKLKRSSQMGNLYRILRGKVEGTELSKSHGGRKSRGAVAAAGGKEGMADALAEMTKRSAYFQQIEEDVEKQAKSITELKSSISTFQTKDMAELLNFHKHVESILEKLTDESQVLARFEGFPSKKLEALRTAAALYSKLDAMSTELQNWKIVAPLGQLLDKVEHYFNKIKGDIEALERTKDEESKKFQSHNIHFDFSILIKIKELMVDVSSNCMELALKLKSREAELADVSGNKDEGRKKESVKMLWRAFQFAFRVYTFAGGHDDRADNLTRELAHEIEADPNHQ